MAHGLEGGVERERLRTMVAMASIFLDRDTKACQFRNGVRKGPLVYIVLPAARIMLGVSYIQAFLIFRVLLVRSGRTCEARVL